LECDALGAIGTKCAIQLAVALIQVKEPAVKIYQISQSLAALAALLCLSAQAQAWVSVGSSPGFGTCTYATIADALADGDSEIRILSNQVFTENILIADSRTLRGGFTSCLAASLDLKEGNNTEINGSGAALLPTILVLLSNPGVVTLHDLKITGGAVGVATGSTAGVLNIHDSLIVANSGSFDGAGLRIDNPGDTLQVVIRGSSILGNSTTESGGGIYCNHANGLIRLESGAILENSAGGDGGGVWLGNGCRFSSFSGSRIEDGSMLRGILSNSAAGSGGGVYAAAGAQVEINGHLGPLGLWGNTTDPATVANNTAFYGGAVYATGNDTLVEMIDTVVRDNVALNLGGGALVASGATLNVDVSGASCWNGFRCSQWRNNQASAGSRYGGHVYVDAASVQIDRTHLTGGRAQYGTAIYATGWDAVLSMEGSYLTGNGLTSPPSATEYYVVRLLDSAHATLRHVTVAGNSSSQAVFGVLGAGSQVDATNSIVFNGGLPVLATSSGGEGIFSCVIANEDSSTGAGVVVVDPGFRNQAAGDYRLSASSPAIDRCADAGATRPDDEGHPRGIDDPGHPNLAGTYDTGADEFLLVDSLFADRFAN
jgi:predicted outer membrane repeat protein